MKNRINDFENPNPKKGVVIAFSWFLVDYNYNHVVFKYNNDIEGIVHW